MSVDYVPLAIDEILDGPPSPWLDRDHLYGALDAGIDQSDNQVTRLTGDYRGNVASLYGATKWGGDYGTGAVITYSFPEAGAAFESFYGYNDSAGVFRDPSLDWSALASNQRDAVRLALDAWAQVADIEFVEVADTATTAGDLRFGLTADALSDDTVGFAFFPDEFGIGGDVWFNREVMGPGDWEPGSTDFHTVVHEIGHAIGLKHPFDDDPTNPVTWTGGRDSHLKTVMSYQTLPGILDGQLDQDYYPATPMWADIRAVQFIYGKIPVNGDDTAYLIGDAVGFDPAAHRYPADSLITIYDTGGLDTIRYQGAADASLNLKPGSWSRVGEGNQIGSSVFDNLRIETGSLIENGTVGAGGDWLRGNNADNRLSGGGGNDRLKGKGGDDTIDGGRGSDTAEFRDDLLSYDFDAPPERADADLIVVHRAGAGSDGTDQLVNVEFLAFTDQTVSLESLLVG